MDLETTTELEAATFRRLVHHLQTHTEVQNIDLMLLADFCRNCLAKWYAQEAKDRGISIEYPEAQTLIYGMPYDEWKGRFQTEASPDQLERMEERRRQQQQPPTDPA